MEMLSPAGWNLRGYPNPYLTPELERLAEGGANSEKEQNLVDAADRFAAELPQAPRHNLKLPEDPRAVVLAAARTSARVAAVDSLSKDAHSHLDRARYGMVRALSAQGMWAAKRQLEDAVLKIEMPERCERQGQRLREFQDTHRDFTAEVESAISRRLSEAGIDGRVLTAWCSVDGASRRLQKLRLPNFNAARPPNFYDVYVLVDGPNECYRALQAVHKAGSPAPSGFQDLIVSPHSNGFSALRTRIKVERRDDDDNVSEEISKVVIQTPLMHEIGWHGIAHPACAGNPADQPPFIAMLRGTNERAQTGTRTRARQIDASPRITVYAQGGRLLEPTPHDLQVGATVLDLAYKIHDAIGNEATSAVVDDKLVESLGHGLEDGAVVMIRRDPGGRNIRSEDDFDLVTTAYALRCLKRGLRQQSPTMRGRLSVLRQLKGRGVPIRGRDRLDKLVEAVAGDLKGDLDDRSAEGIYRHLGLDRSTEETDDAITAGSVAAAVADEVVRVGTERLLPADSPSEQWRPVFADVAPLGARFARLCGQCHPAPHEPIVGLKRPSHTTVHLKTCRHARGHDVLPMRWTRVEGRVRSVINLAGVDRNGLVIDVCERVGRLGCGLEQVTAKADYMGKARMSLHIYADSSATVSELVHDLSQVTGVTTAYQDSMQLPPPGDSHHRVDGERQSLSRPDVSTAGLHVRQDRLPVRHDLIHIPYDPQRPCYKGRFFGREDESETLIRCMKRGTDPFVFICGPRMIGKSSLALRFCDKLAEGDRPHVLRVDLRTCAEATSREVFEKIIAEIRGSAFDNPEIRDRDSPQDTLDALVDSRDKRLLLILDEFGGPLESFRDTRLGGQFFRWIRTALERQRGKVTLMMAGPPEAADLLHGVANRDLGERLDTFTLRVLTASAAREMFVEPLRNECIAVRDGAAEMVVDHCGGHPYYLICLLRKVANRLDLNRRRWHVTRTDIARGIADLLADHVSLGGWIAESAANLESELCLDSIARTSAGRSQYVDIADIARSTKLEPSEVEPALEQLHGQQVIERSPEGLPAYRSAFPLLHEWVRQGGIRRNYFGKLDQHERRCLLALCEGRKPTDWLTSRKLAAAAGLSSEHTADAVTSLVKKNVLESRRDRTRLTVPALWSWVEDERRREQVQATA